MAAGAVDVTIAAPPEEVWEKVGDFAGVRVLFPAIESFRMEGDDRIIGMFGMEIRERLLARDEEARVLTYSVVGGVPIESHTATISVEPEGAGPRSSGPTTSAPTRWRRSSATPTKGPWPHSRHPSRRASPGGWVSAATARLP